MHDLMWLLGAEVDVQELYSDFESRRDGRGDEFLFELHYRLDLLRRNPRMGPIFMDPIRRLILPKSFVGIYYIVDSKRVSLHSLFSLYEPEHVVKRRLYKLLGH